MVNARIAYGVGDFGPHVSLLKQKFTLSGHFLSCFGKYVYIGVSE